MEEYIYTIEASYYNAYVYREYSEMTRTIDEAKEKMKEMWEEEFSNYKDPENCTIVCMPWNTTTGTPILIYGLGGFLTEEKEINLYLKFSKSKEIW